MKDSEKKFTVSYTELECKSCKKLLTRKFEDGDIVFEENGNCDQCEGNLLIVKIFGEIIG
ncbi:MAG: hypothetical protein VX209_01035 [Thermoproteota archaeon]|nr:hypothetical protein [Thermoproteota archaeon]